MLTESVPHLVKRLKELTIEVDRCKDLDALGQTIERFLEEFTPLDHSGLYFYDKEAGKLVLSVAHGFTDDERIEAERTAMERHPGEVFRSRQALHLNDPDAMPSSSPRSFHVRSRLFLPVMDRDECVGTFGIVSEKVNAFDEQDNEILAFLCGIAGIAYGRVTLEKETAKAQARNRENEARLKTLNSRITVIIKNLNVGILVEDENRRIVLTNQLFCDLFAIPLTPEQMLGQDCTRSAEASKQMFIYPDYFVSRIDQILEQKIPVIEEELILTDGRIFERDYIPIFIDAHYRGHLWQYRDVTSRKNAENNLIRLAFVAKHTDNIVIITDKTGRIEWVNNSFWWVTGYSLEEAKGKFPGELLQGPETNAETKARIREALKEKRSVTEEILNYKKNGMPYWLELSINPILDENGDVIFFIAIESDITSRKQNEESIQSLNRELTETNQLLTIERDKEKERVDSLERLSQMKTEFVSSVSHELRTPLASIIGFAETILSDRNLTPELIREFMTILLGESRRLANLIDDLLDLGRIESGRITLMKEPQPVTPLLDDILGALVIQIEAKRLKVTSTVVPPDLSAEFDAMRLRQALNNLLSNAIKFTPDDGSISVDVCLDGNDVVFKIEDTGLGIPAEDMPYLFTRFFRVHRPGIEIRGTGLGLTITKYLIELHGGSISVQSELGKGSIFTVRFPAQ